MTRSNRAKRPANRPRTQRLPNDLILRIADMLPHPNRWRVAQSNRALRNRINTPALKPEAIAQSLWHRLENVLDKAVVHFKGSLDGAPVPYIPLSLKFKTFTATVPSGTFSVNLSYDPQGINILFFKYPSLGEKALYRIQFSRELIRISPYNYEYANGKGFVYGPYWKTKPTLFTGDWSMDLILSRLDTALRHWSRRHGLKFMPEKQMRFTINARPRQYS